MTLDSIADGIVSDMAKTVNITLPERERLKRIIVSRIEPLRWQSCLDFSDVDFEKNDEQCSAILGLLKERGDAGATNVELNSIAINHTGRVSDLRKKGFVIQCQRGTGRVFHYRLIV